MESTPGGERESAGWSAGALPFEMASRMRRAAGAVVDAAFNAAVGMVAYVAIAAASGLPLEGMASLTSTQTEPAQWNPLAFAASLVPLAIQWVLIGQTGQSVGKRFLGTQIVLRDGRAAGWVHGVLLRSVPFVLLGMLPSLLVAAHVRDEMAQPVSLLAMAISLVDVLRIFRPSRRCLHDEIAGTFVAG